MEEGEETPRVLFWIGFPSLFGTMEPEASSTACREPVALDPALDEKNFFALNHPLTPFRVVGSLKVDV